MTTASGMISFNNVVWKAANRTILSLRKRSQSSRRAGLWVVMVRVGRGISSKSLYDWDQKVVP